MDCQNGGTCLEGNCECPVGFSGEECELEDKCISQNVTCENGGTCTDGTCDCADNYYGETCANRCVNGDYVNFNGSCECDTGWAGTSCDQCAQNFTGSNCDACIDGYEGDDCLTQTRTKFIANYSVSEVCDNGTDSYSAFITASAEDEQTILISNFYNVFSSSVQATVNGSEITIAEQEPDNDGFTVFGSGSINAEESVLTIIFTVSDGVFSDNCTATYTK
ncbi:MAG: hypothetical protein WEC59_05950 [Salibacteraceae bacterium]